MSPEIYGNLIIGSAAGRKFLIGDLAFSGQKTAIIERRSIGGQAVIPAAGHRASSAPSASPGFPPGRGRHFIPESANHKSAFKSRALDRCSLRPKYL
jgi:hypothetical protein